MTSILDMTNLILSIIIYCLIVGILLFSAGIIVNRKREKMLYKLAKKKGDKKDDMIKLPPPIEEELKRRAKCSTEF